MTRERNIRNTMTSCALILALLATTTLFTATPAAAQATQTNPNAITVTGTVAATGQILNGVFDISRFTRVGNTLAAVGRLTGTLTNPVTGVVTQISQIITVPLQIANATCEILDLSLGPVDLDLLGLVVHLDQVNLQITAQSGPGNLLGNLLCAVAGLLDNGGALQRVVGLLNEILRILS